jgi:DNA-binding MarR family transcriptional regulator
MRAAKRSKRPLIERIVGQLTREHSTAAVLLHHAVAERLGLGPTDLECLDLLRERGAMTGSDLAGVTGLTTGAITGVVARLERRGFLRREPDPRDGRKQALRADLASARVREIRGVFEPLHRDAATILEGFKARQLVAIVEFLEGLTTLVYRQIGSLRSHQLDPASTPTTPGRRREGKR